MNPEISYVMRKRLERAGVPFRLCYGDTGDYLAAWFAARTAGKKLSVAEACKAAGFSPDALRQRRKHNPSFRAAERVARFGEPYVEAAPVVGPPQDVVPANLLVTDTTYRRPPAPIVEVEHGRPVGPDEPTITTHATPPAPPRKRKPTRRFTPQWVGGTGYERY